VNFLDRFSKTARISNFTKSVHWEASCSTRTRRHDEANDRLSEFCKHA